MIMEKSINKKQIIEELFPNDKKKQRMFFYITKKYGKLLKAIGEL